MKTKMKYVIGGAAVVVAASCILYLAAAGTQRADVVPATVKPVAVEVAPVRVTPLRATVEAVGTVTAMKDVTVSSETSGRVTRVHVKVGDRVVAGQVLVSVDDELKVIAVDQAKAQLLAAESNFGKARRDFERSEKLLASGDIADVEVETYRIAMRSAEAQYKGAQVALRYAERQLDDTRIKAPIAGVVASRNVELGEMLAPGKEVANVVDIGSVKVKVGVPEEEIINLRTNQKATVRIDSRPDITFQGTVYTIGSKSESPTGHSYPAEVVVRNKDVSLLKVGMFARVEIETGSVDKALAVSKESMVSDGATPKVYVVEEGIARLRPVKTGVRTSTAVQIVDGLREGDLVISFGQKNVKDGVPVTYAR